MRRGFFAIVLTCVFAAFFASISSAQTASPPPEKVTDLMKLMSDPEVKA